MTSRSSGRPSFPVPSIRVSLASPTVQPGQTKQAAVEVEAYIDTGADISVLPTQIAEMIGVSPQELIQVSTIGSTMAVPVVILVVGIPQSDGPAVNILARFVVLEGIERPLLGRELLAQIGITLKLSPFGIEVLLERPTWAKFEDDVASLFRQLGANVKQNVTLSGFQIDVYVEEITNSGQKLRQAIECKDYQRPIGNHVANDFLRTISTLVGAGLVDRGVLVSRAGFTPSARAVGETGRIELFTLQDLRQAVAKSSKSPRQPVAQQPGQPDSREPEGRVLEVPRRRSPDVFVAMPFTEDLNDLYFLGIVPAVSENGLSCGRADQMEFVGNILERVQGSIIQARLVVAEVTSPNPNVYYEIGYAQGTRVPVIPVTRDPRSSSFDLRGQNHIVYESIRDLKTRLSQRLKAFLAGS